MREAHAKSLTGNRIDVAGGISHEKYATYLGRAGFVGEGAGAAQLGGDRSLPQVRAYLRDSCDRLSQVDSLGAEHRDPDRLVIDGCYVQLGIPGVIHLDHRTPRPAPKVLAQAVATRSLARPRH